MIIGQQLDSIRAYVRDLEIALAEADALIAQHQHAIDHNPRSEWPKGSLLEKAIARHELRCLHELQERVRKTNHES